MAVQFRLPTHLVHAVGAALAPGAGLAWANHRERSSVPDEWRAAAESWLCDLRGPISA